MNIIAAMLNPRRSARFLTQDNCFAIARHSAVGRHQLHRFIQRLRHQQPVERIGMNRRQILHRCRMRGRDIEKRETAAVKCPMASFPPNGGVPTRFAQRRFDGDFQMDAAERRRQSLPGQESD